jgi:hypothetical protein
VEGRCPPILGSIEKYRAANQKATSSAQNETTAARDRFASEPESVYWRLAECVCKGSLSLMLSFNNKARPTC